MPSLRRLLLTAALPAGAMVCALACGRDDAFQPLPLGRLVSSEPVTCAPSHDWTPAPGGGWEFRGLAEVACWLDDPPPERLVFRLRPDAPTGRHAFLLSWDGSPLGGEPVWGGEEIVVAAPPGSLAPGRHRLTLERFRVGGDDPDPANRFEELSVVAGADPARPLPAAEAERFHRIAAFLLLGATGTGDLSSAGWLLAGPGPLEVALPAGPRRWLRLHPENLSGAAAELRVELAGEVAVSALAPGERGRLEVPVPAGTPRLRLRADGPGDGLFLFGAPRLLAADESRRRDPGRPPIVLVTLDTTRRDALGAYGGPAGVTPNLDRFAVGATVYEDAVSTTSWTLPAHVSMFTGLYPGRHGVGVSRRHLPEELPSLAGQLRQRGYTPMGVAGGLLMSRHAGGARDFLVYRDPLDGLETPADRLTDFAVEMLDETTGEVPFLFLNYFDPHGPYEAPAAFRKRLDEPARRRRLRSPVWLRTAAGDRAAWHQLIHGEAELTRPGLAWLRAVYLAEVAFMDDQVGRLFREIERRGWWDDALVVVVADHGELLGEGGFLTHSYRLDPELVEVPLLIKEPGQVRGRRVAGVASVADLFPTLLAAAGSEAPSGDGRLLAGSAPRRTRALFEEHVSRYHPLDVEYMRVAKHLWGFQGASRRAVVWEEGASCARRGAGGAWAAAPCPEDAARLLAALQALLGKPSADAAAEAGELAEDQREALEALGYL